MKFFASLRTIFFAIFAGAKELKKSSAVFGSFFSLLKFLRFCEQNLQPTVQCVGDREKKSKREQTLF